MRLHQSVKIITLPLQLKTLLTEILWSWRWQFSPHAPLGLPSFEETIIFMATVDNYELLFAKEDPNKPIQPEIPGLCEELIPDVKTWNELISETSVPIPRVWWEPFVGIGKPSAWGGVTTSSFRTNEEPLRSRDQFGTRNGRIITRGKGPHLLFEVTLLQLEVSS